MALRLGVALISAGFLAGCGGDASTDVTPVPAPAPVKPQQQAARSGAAVQQGDGDQPGLPMHGRAASADIGLMPLPTVQQVQQAAPGGRQDPFGVLPAVLAAEQQESGPEGPGTDGDPGGDPPIDPGSVVKLTGVLRVGGEQRALVQNATTSGVLCVSADGRCAGDGEQLLPEGWSVLSIDVQRGCIRLAENGEPQELLCMA